MTSERPSPVVFFVDRSLGKKTVASGLRKAGGRVEIHDAHFRQDAKDEDWLPVVGRKKWVVLTKDKRIRRRPNERAALIKAGVRAFVLTARDLRGEEMAHAFVKALPKMERLAAKHDHPLIATVGRTGLVTIIYPKKKG